jgi:hypothetical protein
MAASSAGGALFTLGIARTSFLRRVSNQIRVAVVLTMALGSAGLIVLAEGPDWLYLLGNAAVGAGLGWLVGAQATVAVLAPANRMGQVEATLVAGLVSAGGAGVLLLGALADAVSPGAAYLAGGLVLAVALTVASRRPPRGSPGSPTSDTPLDSHHEALTD